MAFTVAIAEKNVFGSKRVHVVNVTADAASDAVNTGLNSVDYVAFAHNSMSTATNGGPKLKLNALTAGTASQGFVAVTGVTSGDQFTLICFGK